MRVLVTGSSGFVGGAIADRLLAGGDQVVGLGRRLTKTNRGLTSAIAVDLTAPGVAGRLAETQPRCDAIVHAAASLDQSPHATGASLVNGLGTQQIAELAARWEVSKLVYISSLPVIGRPSALPVTEEHPANPLTAYHASKLYGEHLVALAAVPALSLRLTAPVGTGMPEGRIMTVFVRRALAGEPLVVAGGGTRTQDYVDVRDVASAVKAALDRDATGLLNLASGRAVSNLELANRCVKTLGSSSPVTLSGEPDPEEGLRWEVSIERARAAIGYEPEHTLEDSIAAVAQGASLEVARA